MPALYFLRNYNTFVSLNPYMLIGLCCFSNAPLDGTK
uniref:Uncharacterized protein n=1 Tax=Rhizophora mucronata TaxID=61149 RepID=A0A2P2PYA9_RHIMU